MNTENLIFSWKHVFTPLHWITVLSVVVLDQASKWAVVTHIQMGERIEVTSFLNFIHTKNRGAAFGMFNQSGDLFRLFFFGAVTIVCLYMLFYWLGTIPLTEKLQRLNLSLILGGAFGNVIDRVLYGQVTDFIDAYYGSYHFYTFNIADSGISVGVTLLIISMFFEKSKEKLRLKGPQA